MSLTTWRSITSLKSAVLERKPSVRTIDIPEGFPLKARLFGDVEGDGYAMLTNLKWIPAFKSSQEEIVRIDNQSKPCGKSVSSVCGVLR